MNVGAICSATPEEWRSDQLGCVKETVLDFIALGYLVGEQWGEVSLHSRGYFPLARASTRRSSNTTTTTTTTKRQLPYMAGSPESPSSPPEAARQRATSHVTWRNIPRKFHPEFIVEAEDGLRVAMLVEVLLSDDARGQGEDESNTKYETYLLSLILSEHWGTGQKMPVYMNRSNAALFTLSEVREFMVAVAAGGESAAEERSVFL